MSSDEEEHDGVNLVYRRVTQPWRDTNMVEWFRVIDIFVNARHYSPDGASTPGAHPHLRHQIAKSTSKRAAVPLLPISVYNQTWLKNQSERERDRLTPSEKTDVFQHEPEVLSFVPEHVTQTSHPLTRVDSEAAQLEKRFNQPQ